MPGPGGSGRSISRGIGSTRPAGGIAGGCARPTTARSPTFHYYDDFEFYADELPLLWNAIEVASRTEIEACPYTCTLLDIVETESILGAVWEYADRSLRDFLAEPDADPAAVSDEVACNVGGALAVFHQFELVHLDVAPNNVLRVDGVWKLGDFDACAPVGSPVTRHPLPHYRHPERTDGVPARPEFDHFGLDRMIERLRR